MRDLSGRWAGFYTQHDRQRPITATFVQEGDRLVGRMNDDFTGFETSVSELALEECLPPGADEQIVEKVRSLCPGTENLPVRAEVRLPSESDVEGEVTGHAVRFLKTLRGPYFAGYRVGDFRVGVTGEDPEFQYRGVLSPDGTRIEGRWVLPDPPAQHVLPTRAEGDFVLRRVGETSAN